MTCSYRKRWMCVKKMVDHLIKRLGFFVSKGVGLSLDIWPSRKPEKVYYYIDYIINVTPLLSLL